MESEVAVNPLRVSGVEKFGDQGLGLVGPIEIAAQEGQVVMLDKVIMCGNSSFHEIPPPNFVLANSECSHSWQHRSKGGKRLISPHQNVLRYPVCQLQIGEVLLV